MTWRWPNFTEDEMRCPHCKELKINEQFMDRLQGVRSTYGRPMIITSGYRCPEYNDKISSTGLDGPHTTGRAVDVDIMGVECHVLLGIAFDYRFWGIGLRQKGTGRFIHLDDLPRTDKRPRPWVWTY